MQVQFRTEGGLPVRPCQLAFTVLTTVPDRPAGTQELCPVVHLDDAVVAELGNTAEVETATGVMTTHFGGWAVVDMRKGGIRVVLALDLGDEVVKRWLNDAGPDGPIVGLLASTIARAVRIPMSDIIAAIRRRTAQAAPASLEEQRVLMDRLFEHLERHDEDPDRARAQRETEGLYVALPLANPTGDHLTMASGDQLLH